MTDGFDPPPCGPVVTKKAIAENIVSSFFFLAVPTFNHHIISLFHQHCAALSHWQLCWLIELCIKSEYLSEWSFKLAFSLLLKKQKVIIFNMTTCVWLKGKPNRTKVNTESGLAKLFSTRSPLDVNFTQVLDFWIGLVWSRPDRWEL